jgi:hypothetical protein
MESYKRRITGREGAALVVGFAMTLGFGAFVGISIADGNQPKLVDCENGESGTIVEIFPNGKDFSMKPVNGDDKINIQAGSNGKLIFNAFNSGATIHPDSGSTITGGDVSITLNSPITFSDKGADYKLQGFTEKNNQSRVEITASCPTK